MSVLRSKQRQMWLFEEQKIKKNIYFFLCFFGSVMEPKKVNFHSKHDLKTGSQCSRDYCWPAPSANDCAQQLGIFNFDSMVWKLIDLPLTGAVIDLAVYKCTDERKMKDDIHSLLIICSFCEDVWEVGGASFTASPELAGMKGQMDAVVACFVCWRGDASGSERNTGSDLSSD